jgi:hypothetical protein
MASIIRIKRSGVAGNPNVLAQGELAYSYLPDNGANGGDRLYIGTGPEVNGDAANHTVIGGAHYVDLLHGEADASYGINLPNKALIVDVNGAIDQLTIGDINFTSGGIGGDPLATFNFNGARLTNLSEPVDNSDAATKFYVDNLITSQELGSSFSFNGDTGSGDVFLNTEVFNLLGGRGIQTTADSDTNSLTVGLVPTGVTAGSYGSQTSIPTFSVDSDGRLTAAGEVDVGTNLTVNGDSISLLDSDLTFTGSENIDVTYDSLTNTVTTSLKPIVQNLTSVSVGNLRLEGNTLFSTDSSNTLYIDPAPTDSDGGTLVIRGDLVVQGTQTIINSTVMSINDLTLTLADEATTPAEADGAGIFIAGADVSIVYNASKDQIDIDKGLNVLAPLSINDVEIGEFVDDRVASLLTAGTGIDLTYVDSSDELLISANVASNTILGVASFDSDQFIVTNGAVNIYSLDGGSY